MLNINTRKYQENTQFTTIIKTLLLDILNAGIAVNHKFDVCSKTIANAVINPSKVSYIKKDKIKSLAKHAKVKITNHPTAEQRNKYFAACSITKFVNSYFDKTNLNCEQLEDFNMIVKNATHAAAALLPKTFHILDAKHIPTIYNQQHTDATVGNRSACSEQKPVKYPDIETPLYLAASTELNSSCMQGKPKNYFEIYNDLNPDTHTLKIAILTQNDEIVARALVWIDKPTHEIDRRKKLDNSKIFIDRIYCKTQEHRQATQVQMFNEIHKYFNVDTKTNYTKDNPSDYQYKFANCFNWYDIKETIQAEQNTTKTIYCNSRPSFDVELLSDYYSYYPYCDTFQYFDTYNNTLSSDESSGNEIIQLSNVDGTAAENNRECENCGSEMCEDDERWIETAEQSVCEDCATYCEDRSEYILSDDAIYNNFTGNYHLCSDLDT